MQGARRTRQQLIELQVSSFHLVRWETLFKSATHLFRFPSPPTISVIASATEEQDDQNDDKHC